MVGEVEVCTECKNTGNVPINGQCTTVANAANCKKVGGGELDPNAQTCGQCTDAYFLYKGGCYQIGQSPGSLICADKQASGTTGTCKACVEGYFTVSSATATQDSCVACGDENCATCTEGTTPQKCSKCKAAGEKLYLKKESSGTGTCVSAVECTAAGSYFPDSTSDPKECKACEATCATCAGAAASQCTSCKTDKPYLKKDSPTNPAGTCVAADGCGDGSYADTSSKECKACHGDCAACTGALETDCTSCQESSKYLKVLDAENGSGQCVAPSACTGTHFPVTDDKKCYLCNTANKGGVTDCQTCSKPEATVVCSACTTDTNKPNVAGSACVACSVANCASCDNANVCALCTNGQPPAGGACPSCADKNCADCTGGDGACKACKEGYRLSGGACEQCTVASCKACAGSKDVCEECMQDTVLSPSKLACSATCPVGSYTSGAQCLPCDASCASCDTEGPAKCKSCYPGYVLSYAADGATGTCIRECTGAAAAGCESSMCNAKIAGSSYCSKCVAGQAPINGICTSVTRSARDATGCAPSGGQCTACTGEYFLQFGGCYEKTKFPGNAVCTSIGASGKCSACVSGQAVAGDGTCPSCADNCETCAASTPSQCTKCFAGFYLNTAKGCTPCSADSAPITGIKNCMSCDPPSSTQGAVTCYVTQDPTVDPTDPSVNK
ncbi:VSP [Giardia duodenalis ATCC 50581]|uniref:VSP n=1 Tax=Giardia intestinalis (strain ATCC 50581 / GS clone H7) TaxID=598745 RepID=C6LPA7_GIAIB|nr:VSP [Giardia intestinalis ATCC 50581]